MASANWRLSCWRPPKFLPGFVSLGFNLGCHSALELLVTAIVLLSALQALQGRLVAAAFFCFGAWRGSLLYPVQVLGLVAQFSSCTDPFTLCMLASSLGLSLC